MKETLSYHEFLAQWKELLRQGMDDDGWQWDWTSKGLPAESISGEIVAKDAGVWSASGIFLAAEQLALELGLDWSAKVRATDGNMVYNGTSLVRITGSSRAILALERPLLNLSSYVCGISTATHSLCEVVKVACPQDTPRITATRKTLPFYRDVSLYGVMAGGGHCHRVGLSGGVLIKENHIRAAGGIKAAIEVARGVAPHGIKIETEVTNMEELDEAVEYGAEVVMLDNFNPELIAKAVDRLKNSKVTIEVSGGVTPENIKQFAIPGVHVISSGFLTHSVKALDLSFQVLK